MGACQSAQTKKKSYRFLLNSIFRCPNGHWLAQYSTPQCTNCIPQNEDHKIPAKFSCTKCAYSLCENCYQKKVQKCRKKSKSFNPEITNQFIDKMITSFNSSVQSPADKQMMGSSYKRFVKHTVSAPQSQEIIQPSSDQIAQELLKRVVILTTSKQISTLKSLPSKSQTQ